MATQGGGFRPEVDIKRYVALWKSGQLDISGIVSHKLRLDQINDGIELVKSGRVMIYP